MTASVQQIDLKRSPNSHVFFSVVITVFPESWLVLMKIMRASSPTLSRNASRPLNSSFRPRLILCTCNTIKPRPLLLQWHLTRQQCTSIYPSVIGAVCHWVRCSFRIHQRWVSSLHETWEPPPPLAPGLSQALAKQNGHFFLCRHLIAAGFLFFTDRRLLSLHPQRTANRRLCNVLINPWGLDLSIGLR